MAENLKLFSKVANVILNVGSRETRRARLTVRIDLLTESSPIYRKLLAVEITDPSDPFFLYTLHLAEDGFQRLKVDQGLLIDFTSFPQKLIEYIEQCMNEEKQDEPRFILQLSESGGSPTSASESRADKVHHLSVVQVNTFKHLTHLTLPLSLPSDDQLKQYLAECVHNAKAECSQVKQRLEETHGELTRELQQVQETLGRRNRELDDLQNELESKLSLVIKSHEQKLQEERSKYELLESKLRERHDGEKRKLESEQARVKMDVDLKLDECRRENKELIDKKYKAEAAIRELKAKLTSAEHELRQVKDHNEDFRARYSSLEHKYCECERVCHEQEKQVAMLHQDLANKDNNIDKMQHSHKLLQENSTRVEKLLTEREETNRKQEEALHVLNKDIRKAHDIISQLQKTNKSINFKLNLHKKIASGQEETNVKLDETVRKLNKDLETVTDERDKLSIQVGESQELNKELTEEVEKKSEQCKAQQQVISWLNDQLNNRALGSEPATSRLPGPGVARTASEILGGKQNIPATAVTSAGAATSKLTKPLHSTPVSDVVTADFHSTLHDRAQRVAAPTNSKYPGANVRSQVVREVAGNNFGLLHPKYLQPSTSNGHNVWSNKENRTNTHKHHS